MTKFRVLQIGAIGLVSRAVNAALCVHGPLKAADRKPERLITATTGVCSVVLNRRGV
ncbi:hypothetical protein [Tabrizicola sp.]|uniref:hypothetical protein n=1 Tax=Tabrizicola sp. TaxID=2005166 RepID=UPI003F38289E